MSTSPVNEIRTIEADGLFWVHAIMDDEALSRRGPFADLEAAEAMAIQMAAICKVICKPMEVRRG